MDANADADADKYMRLLISSITLDIVQRAYDTTIAVAVGSLSVEDSSRPAKQRFLILSKNLNSDGMLLERPLPLPLQYPDDDDPGVPKSAAVVKEISAVEVDEVKPFATIAVCQIFDCLSPDKRGMDTDVNRILNPESVKNNSDRDRHRERDRGVDVGADTNMGVGVGMNVGIGRGDVEMLRELDEGLIIRVVGLSISVDARAVRQIHEIVEPVFACIFSSPVDTAFDTSQAPFEGSGVNPLEMRSEGDDVSSCPRGRAVGCLENEWGDRGRHYTELVAEVQTRPGQEIVRALLKLDLRVDVITIDMLKVASQPWCPFHLANQSSSPLHSSSFLSFCFPVRCSHHSRVVHFVLPLQQLSSCSCPPHNITCSR